jgi:hypothetical protein
MKSTTCADAGVLKGTSLDGVAIEIEMPSIPTGATDHWRGLQPK